MPSFTSNLNASRSMAVTPMYDLAAYDPQDRNNPAVLISFTPSDRLLSSRRSTFFFGRKAALLFDVPRKRRRGEFVEIRLVGIEPDSYLIVKVPSKKIRLPRRRRPDDDDFIHLDARLLAKVLFIPNHHQSQLHPTLVLEELEWRASKTVQSKCKTW